MADITIFETDEIYLCHSITEKPQVSDFHAHAHETAQIVLILSGNAELSVEGNVYSLGAGCLTLVRGTEVHRTLIKSSAPYERYNLHFFPKNLIKLGFPETLFRPFLDRELGKYNLYLPSEFPDVPPQRLFKKMFSEAALPDDRRHTLLINFASLLVSINAAFDKKGQSVHVNAYENSTHEIIDYVNENLFSDLSLASLSEALHISPSQINRTFKRLMGTSVYHYILSKRLVAAQMLITNGESATVASQKCGFRDYSSFYRLYKKHFGTAPTGTKKNFDTVHIQ